MKHFMGDWMFQRLLTAMANRKATSVPRLDVWRLYFTYQKKSGNLRLGMAQNVFFTSDIEFWIYIFNLERKFGETHVINSNINWSMHLHEVELRMTAAVYVGLVSGINHRCGAVLESRSQFRMPSSCACFYEV